MTGTADMRRLGRVLGAYGADPKNWPADERDALGRLASVDDPEVEAMLREAGEIDAVLDRLTEIEAPSGVADRVSARTVSESAAKTAGPRFARAGRPSLPRAVDVRRAVPVGVAMAASLVLGVLVGLNDRTAVYVPETNIIALADNGADGAVQGLIDFEILDLAEGEEP